eukprot:augustus_masked-scaffold_15-processed-gene-0.46-mRNA-1 protein AED:0.09 eAED:0.16 QI:0/-1/0/1/-1/1/1/0/326
MFPFNTYKELIPVKDKFVSLEDLKLLPENPDWGKKFLERWSIEDEKSISNKVRIGEKGAKDRYKTFLRNNLKDYKNRRDLVYGDYTSNLSPSIHFGEVSVRKVYLEVLESFPGLQNQGANTFISELGWREYSYYLFYHFPNLHRYNFKPVYNSFPWKNSQKETESHLQAWKKGKTGIPLVDAAMRELWNSGFMHNRARMVVASFLTKNLGIHWHHGAKHFHDCLLDADLACNSFGWQWVAGSGADAAPYYRIFNPITQQQRFDKNMVYTKRWVSELREKNTGILQYIENGSKKRKLGNGYPKAIVDVKTSRKDALKLYEVMKQQQK